MALELLQTIANLACGVALFSFTLVATASRSLRAELVIQSVVSLSSIIAAFALLGIALQDGEFWGSQNLVQPLIAMCIIIAITSRMNLRGKQLSQGMNPHSIRLLSEEE